MLNMLIWLWGAEGPPDKKADHFVFRPEDACRLAEGIRANLRMPHKITIVSDYPKHHYPSWTEYLSIQGHFGQLRALRGCWLRLKCFAPELSDVLGPRVAWVDADSIICGNLDPLFNRPEPLVLYRSRSIPGQRWNGSVSLFSPAENRDIWAEFDPERSPQFVRELRGGMKIGPRGTDQAWLHSRRDED